MGLDVIHYKLTHEPVDKERFITIDQWDCNVPIEAYAAYITDIENVDCVESIAIADGLMQLNMLRESGYFNGVGYQRIFYHVLYDDISTQIERFVKEHNLQGLEMVERVNEYRGLRYRNLRFIKRETKKGMYHIEAGYQRKGMNDDFYTIFGGDGYWGKKEDFEKAYDCVGGDWYLNTWGTEAVEAMKQDFKANFLDNFEFGRSLLLASF